MTSWQKPPPGDDDDGGPAYEPGGDNRRWEAYHEAKKSKAVANRPVCKKSVQSTEVISETNGVRVTVLNLSDDAKRGLSTDGAQLRAEQEPADSVNRPAHYCHGIETIDAIESWRLGFCLGNVVKYVSRAGRKSTATYVEDLQKARWYLDREIARVEKER